MESLLWHLRVLCQKLHKALKLCRKWSELLSEVAKAVAKMPNPWWYFIPPLECLTSPASSRATCSGWWGLVCCIFIPSSLPRSSDQCWPAEWDCGAGQELVWPNVNSSLCTWQRASCWSQVYSVSKVLQPCYKEAGLLPPDLPGVTPRKIQPSKSARIGRGGGQYWLKSAQASSQVSPECQIQGNACLERKLSLPSESAEKSCQEWLSD